jgi:hypothetical protein
MCSFLFMLQFISWRSVPFYAEATFHYSGLRQQFCISACSTIFWTALGDSHVSSRYSSSLPRYTKHSSVLMYTIFTQIYKQNFFLIHYKVKCVLDGYFPVLEIVKGNFLVCRVIIYLDDEGQLALLLHKYLV